jgi:hypothetical protein
MEKVKVEDAVGMVLAHDLTKIVPGSFKGAAFKKGHVIRAEDIEELKNIGKEHIFIVPLTADDIQENDAAYRVAKTGAYGGLAVLEPLEGKANIQATIAGVLRVNYEALNEINQSGDIALVTLHDHSMVAKDQIVAAAKVIPLVMAKRSVEQAEAVCLCHRPLLEVKPLVPLKTGIIVSGSEVYYGRIQDRFGEVLKEKIHHYGGTFFDLQYAPDDSDFLYQQIMGMVEQGAEMVLISGGMAVDADDVTPAAIRRAATEVVTYGVPVLPGSMCMVAYHQEIPIIGIPACAMFNKTTIFDLVLPRLLTKEKIQRNELLALAHGGLCLQCEECHYPNCSFGK